MYERDNISARLVGKPFLSRGLTSSDLNSRKKGHMKSWEKRVSSSTANEKTEVRHA